MRTLFAFLWRYHFTVLFIVLEGIALTFLFNSYSYHRSLVFNTVNDFTGKIYSISNDITGYFALRSENEQLLEENQRMYNHYYARAQVKDSSLVAGDSLFRFIPAKVISSSVDNRNNFILIDKGASDGIEKEMGVVSSRGLVGIVIGVSDHYAYIMSMLHKNSRISARIKKNDQLVSVVWEGMNYRYGTVIDIPSHILLNPGDTIVTSGFSLIFPDNITIGTVTGQEKTADKALGNAQITFSTDFNELIYVYVLENINKGEQQDLMDQFDDE
ncbi:MAG: rod shape-determining protein MreC [bacterium]